MSALGGCLLLAAVDGCTGRARLTSASPWASPLFAAFGPLDPEIGSRIATGRSQLTLPGFPAGTPVRLELRLSTAQRRPFEVVLLVNDRPAGAGRLRAVPGLVVADGVADERGEARLRFASHEGSAAIHFYGLEATWQRRGLRGFRALLACLAPLLLGGLLAGWSAGSRRGAIAGRLAAALALAWALGVARLELLAQAPRLAACLGAGLALALACSAAGLPRTWTRWYVAALALRLWLVTQAVFPCVDCAFHQHRSRDFERARLFTSAAPGPAGALVVPYPPAFYAALQPVSRMAGPGPRGVRWAILLLEGTAPLLLAAVVRAGGGSRAAAAAAAAALAVMPEGLLVAAKGVAANVFGGWATLLALWALARTGTSTATLAAILALGLLSHVGAATTLAGAVVLFLASTARRHPQLARRGLAALLVAAAVAWLAYYREVGQVVSSAAEAVAGSAVVAGPAGWGLRWFRVGKLTQDLLLKFGAAPLLLAAVAWRGRALPEALHRLAASCLAVAGVAGLAALTTPFPLRFEYFAAPVVAMLAGAGAEMCESSGRRRLAQAALGLALAVQAAVGLALIEGWIDPIDVTMESPRWPLRDDLLARLPGR